MSKKKLVLRPRAPKSDGVPAWHDSFVLTNGIEEMAKGKRFAETAVYLSIAAKIEVERSAPGQDGKPRNVTEEIVIELSPGEARKLWDGIKELVPEQYGREVNLATGQTALKSPPPGLLWLMLCDVAAQLGEKMPDVD